VVSFVLRLVLLVVGLLFAASLAVAAVLMLAVWSVRAGWAKLTGKPVTPFIIRIDPRGGFQRMYRRAGPASSRTPRADSVRHGRPVGDVTDVEARSTEP
jgi:hypothetical protein